MTPDKGKVTRQQQVGRQTGVRLQIARDNTARRIEVETNEERRNRLQLLQQNGAMYRENDRLQHQQDQNNRESYLSNGWRNAEQPLHEQQWVQTEIALVDFQHYTGPPFLHYTQDHLSCTHTLRLSQYHHTYLNGKLKGNDCQDSNYHFV